MKKSDKNYPNLVIIGPPKTGSTSLFHYLEQHPDVCGSSKKETYFFYDHADETSYYKNFNTHGLDPYFEYFKHYANEKVIVEASPSYVYMKTPLEQFLKFPEPPKIFFVHRDPAKRVYSEYTFSKYKLKSFEGSFADYLGFDGQSFTSERFKEGFYESYLNNWRKAFQENVYSFEFQELSNNPLGFMKKVCLAVDIDPTFYEDYDFSVKNKTAGLRNVGLHKFALKVKDKLPKGIFRLLNPIYSKLNSYQIPAMNEEEAKLVELLKQAYKNKSVEVTKHG